jgi:sugar O-acyltransferase (sialic acid O-acetyltransferase NeuD family)
MAHYYAVNDLDMNVLGFVVDDVYKIEEEFLGLPIYTWSAVLNRFSPQEVNLFVAIGYKSMRMRAALHKRVKEKGYSLVNIVSSSAIIEKNVVMEDNNIVLPGVVIEPGVKIGANNIIWSNATICHDSSIASHNFIAANSTIGGAVSVGDQNFLGFSSVVLQYRRVGSETLIGAQTLVNRDTEDLSVYWGVPARRTSSIDPDVGLVIND